MAETDTGKDHLNKLKSQHQAALHSLITHERTQKYELLLHLLANLRQPLVVCGPEGIGKSTLLAVLQKNDAKSWYYCRVKGSERLSFEAIQAELARALSQDKSEKHAKALPAQFALFEGQNRKIVLMIDDAGALIPGLIAALIQYAAANNPVLKLIFVLTHDELHVKGHSDPALEDCHVIEIPPLSEKQCGEFLRHLASRAYIQLPINSISDDMIETVYRETHGVPGRIITKLPHIAVGKQKENLNWLLPVAVFVLVVVALTLQWLSGKQDFQEEAITPDAVEQPLSVNTEPKAPEPLAIDLSRQLLSDKAALSESPFTKEAEGFSRGSGSLDDADAAQKPASEQNRLQLEFTKLKPIAGENEPAKQPASSPANTEIQKPVPENTNSVGDSLQTGEAAAVSEQPEEQDQGWQWLSEQPANNYSLQLMVLTREESIARVLKKYPVLAQDARSVKKISRGKERFVLLFGSFTSAALALEAKAGLPAEFRTAAIVRKTNRLKKELKPARPQ